MKVVFLSQSFARNMGYLENMLPKYLGRAGAEVHVITTDLPLYHHMGDAEQTYKGFAEPEKRAGRIEECENFTLHVLGHRKVLGHTWMSGLRSKLASLQPDIVQTTTTLGWLPLQATSAKRRQGFKLFVGSHYHSSVFPLARANRGWWHPEHLKCKLARALPGAVVSAASEKCYAITTDCAELAIRFFGMSAGKVEICPLGVDTEIFWPLSTDAVIRARRELRRQLGFADGEIVCVYSGRFSEEKNPLLLAQAIADLRRMGKPYRGLFVGNGVQADAIRSIDGSTVRAFVPVTELGDLFRASDIAVWPTQESTSMLDAAACGLPVVANDTMCAPERLTGNGLTYRLNDRADLQRTLLRLENAQTRRTLGHSGAIKMAREFSWQSIAARRYHDYQAALGIVPAARVLRDHGRELVGDSR